MEMLTYHNKNNRRTTYVIVYNEMTKIKSYFLDGVKSPVNRKYTRRIRMKKEFMSQRRVFD